jgi:hypothetical protein
MLDSNLLNGRAALELAKRTYPRARAPSACSQANTDLEGALPRRHVLPRDLPSAIKQLGDQELDQLVAAALAEQKQRGRTSAESIERREPRTVTVSVHLTPGKVNAVRAAFKAGVRPSLIARQFGLSQTDVRRALGSQARTQGDAG